MAAQPAAAGPMSAAEMERFEVEGFCTIDSPLTAAQLDIAERAYDSLMAPTPEGVERHQCFNSRLATPVHADADFVATITHAFFEQVASQILRAEEVEYIEVFPLARPPTPHPDDGRWPDWRDEWARGAHCDLQLTRSDFEATPRRDQLMMWLWLSDARPDSGAMRVLPRSHRLIMDHWQTVLHPSRHAFLPRVHGIRPRPDKSAQHYPEGLPDILGDTNLLNTEPTPAVAKRGQVRRFLLFKMSRIVANPVQF